MTKKEMIHTTNYFLISDSTNYYINFNVIYWIGTVLTSVTQKERSSTI